MSESASGRGSMTRDDRDALAMAAGAAERRNRPRMMIVLGAVVLVVGAGVLGTGLAQVGSADGALSASRSQLRRMKTMEREIVALTERAEETGADDAFRRIGDLETRIQGLAELRGMSEPEFLDRREADRNLQPGMQRVELRYRAQDLEFGRVIGWLVDATLDPNTRIPGLEVKALRLNPRENVWAVEVTFSRWERQESG